MSIRFGQFLFDQGRRQLTRHGQPVALSPKAFELLRFLLERRPNVIPKKELIDRLWPDVVVEEGNLRNLIAEIRSATDIPVVRTVHRVGYAFDLPALQMKPGHPTARLETASGTYPLTEGMNVIGRDAGCTVSLDVTGVSRQHARVVLTGGAATVEDLGSKNGTWVNGSRVQDTATLREGDTIRVG